MDPINKAVNKPTLAANAASLRHHEQSTNVIIKLNTEIHSSVKPSISLLILGSRRYTVVTRGYRAIFDLLDSWHSQNNTAASILLRPFCLGKMFSCFCTDLIQPHLSPYGNILSPVCRYTTYVDWLLPRYSPSTSRKCAAREHFFTKLCKSTTTLSN